MGFDIADSSFLLSGLTSTHAWLTLSIIEVLFLLQVHEVEIHSNADNCKDWVLEALDDR